MRIIGFTGRSPLRLARPVSLTRSILVLRLAGTAQRYGLAINIVAGAYFGGAIVIGGSLLWLYLDASSRQNIPWLLPQQVQIELVRAINKDDVLMEPRFALKHYRLVLEQLHKLYHKDEDTCPSSLVVPPILSTPVILSLDPGMANFYVDILLRYARSLLARGLVDEGSSILHRVITDNDLFHALGDAERIAQSCRVISRLVPASDRVLYMQRSIRMLESTFAGISVTPDFTLAPDSRILEELMLSLTDLASAKTALAQQASSTAEREKLLLELFNIFLSSLQPLVRIRQGQETHRLFDCSRNNVVVWENSVRAHIAEVLWARGYRRQAVAWSEEVLADVYYDHANEPRLGSILEGVLQNLSAMYGTLKRPAAQNRCQRLLQEMTRFDAAPETSWLENTLVRFSKIMYHEGPFGIIIRPLLNRFSLPQKLPDLYEYDTE